MAPYLLDGLGHDDLRLRRRRDSHRCHGRRGGGHRLDWRRRARIDDADHSQRVEDHDHPAQRSTTLRQHPARDLPRAHAVLVQRHGALRAVELEAQHGAGGSTADLFVAI